jgi:hypothetical protein
MESLVLWSLTVWPVKGLNNFISAASILRLCEAVRVQFSDPTILILEASMNVAKLGQCARPTG